MLAKQSASLRDRKTLVSSANKINCNILDTYMLFTGREVRMGKDCARGLEYGLRPT